MKAMVIVSTDSEAGNLEKVVATPRGLPDPFELMIVDDHNRIADES